MSAREGFTFRTGNAQDGARLGVFHLEHRTIKRRLAGNFCRIRVRIVRDGVFFA